jgi:phosphate/sulfate permease
MRQKLGSWCRQHPLVTAVVLVGTCAGIGYAAAAVATGKLREALLIAATTLVFGAFLGGVVKFLLEDLQHARDRRDEDVRREREQRDEDVRREREQRDDQARFVTAILADLKSVYDRVERVRILIAAHKSALTYGTEMRDLIDSAVELRNVSRAVDQGTSGILERHLDDLKLAVTSMETYLTSLTDEFKEGYKRIADKQRIYEASFKRLLEEHNPEDRSELKPPRN